MITYVRGKGLVIAFIACGITVSGSASGQGQRFEAISSRLRSIVGDNCVELNPGLSSEEIQEVFFVPQADRLSSLRNPMFTTAEKRTQHYVEELNLSVDYPRISSCSADAEMYRDALQIISSESVRSLHANLTSVDDAGMEAIESCTSLSDLRLGGTLISDGAAKSVGRLSNLVRLDISDTEISDKFLSALESHAKLEFLSVSGTKTKLPGLQSFLAKSRSIVEIHAAGICVPDERIVISSPTLKLLDLSFNNLTHVELGALPELRTLQLVGSRITPEFLASSMESPKLKSVNIVGAIVGPINFNVFAERGIDILIAEPRSTAVQSPEKDRVEFFRLKE
jgi:hypothetical protein